VRVAVDQRRLGRPGGGLGVAGARCGRTTGRGGPRSRPMVTARVEILSLCWCGLGRNQDHEKGNRTKAHEIPRSLGPALPGCHATARVVHAQRKMNAVTSANPRTATSTATAL